MAAIPEPSRLVCLKCRREVTLLRIGAGGVTETLPCGHTAGHTSVPASKVEPQTAA